MFWTVDEVQRPVFQEGDDAQVTKKSIGGDLEFWQLPVGTVVQIYKAMTPKIGAAWLNHRGIAVGKLTEPVYAALKPNSDDLLVFLESDLAPVKLSWQVEDPHRIAITYAIITPESAEMGDYAETGWEDEEGVSVEPDADDVADGVTAVDLAVQYLEREGARYERGAEWFSRSEEDNHDGTVTDFNYFLRGFTPEETIVVQNKLQFR